MTLDALVYCLGGPCTEPQHVRFSDEHLRCEQRARSRRGLGPVSRRRIRWPGSDPFKYDAPDVPEFARLVYRSGFRSFISGMETGCPEGELHIEVSEGGHWRPMLTRFDFQLESKNQVRMIDLMVDTRVRRDGWGRQSLREMHDRFPGLHIRVDAVDPDEGAIRFWAAMEDAGLAEFTDRKNMERLLAMRADEHRRMRQHPWTDHG